MTSSPPRGPLPAVTVGLSVSAVYLWAESKTLGCWTHRVLWAVKLALSKAEYCPAAPLPLSVVWEPLGRPSPHRPKCLQVL